MSEWPSTPSLDTRSSSSAHSFNNRDAHVRLFMKDRENEFLHYKTLRLFVGTWNVNGRPATEDLLPWFKNTKEDPPSLIALGFQELDLSKEALLFTDSIRELEWKDACEKAVNRICPTLKYKTVRVIRLVGVMLILFAEENLEPQITNVAAGTVATGIMGYLGNKGGVAIRFNVFNSQICMVTSHLAAHTDQLERRNQDYKDINEKMHFYGGFLDLNANELSISKHDLVFWFGDLNYRITDVAIDKVKALIKDKNYAQLLKHDQLSKEVESKRVFVKFQETVIGFNPTYKYDVGTDIYDTSEKMRVPAWTDRVLHRGRHIKPLQYDCHPEFKLSDHKPVSHTYEIGVKVIDREKYRFVYEEVMKQLDKLENEYLPQVKLNVTELDYGEIRFMENKVLKLEITNTGQVPADFTFIPKLNETSYCKEWMSIKPHMDCILPRESAVIELEIYVDENNVRLLNTGSDIIEDILVLHLEGGKDFFVTILGKYTLSCFGCSLQTLVQLSDPIRDVDPLKIFEMEKEARETLLDEDPQAPLPIPKELWYLCDSIIRRGKTEEDIFQQRGLHQEIVGIREALDTRLSQELPGNVHSAVEALLIFLDALRNPVIPFSLYDDVLSAASDRNQCEQVLKLLPPVHRKVFDYLIEFMLELLKYSDKNRLDANILGNIFGPVLIRPEHKYDLTKVEMELIGQRKSLFIKTFLLELIHN